MSLPFSPSKPDIASASSSSLALSKKTTLDKPQSQNAAIEDLGIIVSSMNGRIEPPEYTVFETTEVHTSKTGNIISRTINTTRRENIRQTTTYRLPEEKTTVSQIAATRPSIASVPLTTTTTPPPAPAAPAESTAKVPIIAPLTSNNLAALTLTLSGSNATEPQYKFAIVPDSAAKPETAPKCPPLTGTSTQPNRALPTISTKPVNVEAQSTARLHGIPPSDALKSLGKLPPLPPPAFYSVSKPQDVIIHTIIPSNPGATNSSRHYVITPTDAAAQLDLLSLTSSPSAEPKSTSQPIEATSKVTELDAASIISSIASCLVDPRARRRAAPLYTRSTIFDVRVANNTGCESGAKHSEVQSDYQSSASSVLGSDPNVQATRQDPRVRNHPRPASVRNRKRCLLIGIDYAGKEYALYPSQANSEVASNGRRRRSALYYLNSIGAFLARRQNWESFECMVLSDEPNASTDDLPTRKNILIGMQWLVHEAMEGDTLLVYFVGQGGPASMFHRFQSLQPIVKVHSSDTEILIPLDIEECNSPILSVDLFETLVLPLEHKVKLIGIFDSCHQNSILCLPHNYKPNVLPSLSSSSLSTSSFARDSNLLGRARTGRGNSISFLDQESASTGRRSNSSAFAPENLHISCTSDTFGFSHVPDTLKASVDVWCMTSAHFEEESTYGERLQESALGRGVVLRAFIRSWEKYHSPASYSSFLSRLRYCLSARLDAPSDIVPMLSTSHTVDLEKDQVTL